MMNKIFTLLAGTLLLLYSCQNDGPLEVPSEPTSPDKELLQLTCNVSELATNARYHTLSIEGITDMKDSLYDLSVDATWIHLDCDTLTKDGIVEIWTEENDGVKGRRAILTVTSHNHPSVNGSIELYQKGLGDNTDNASDDPLSDFRIGWGMNAYDEFQSSASLRGRIFDLDRLAALDSETSFQSLQEVIRGQSDFLLVTATSTTEMSSQLTNRMDKSSSFLGVKKTMRRYSKISSRTVSEQYCSYSRMSKTVASRSIDAGAIDYIVRHMTADKMPFTEDFRKVYNELTTLINTPGHPDLTSKITAMLNTYGTHMVVEASIGGMIDYIATFDRKQTLRLEEIAEEQSKRVFGKQHISNLSEVRQTLTSSISKEGSIEVKGGDPTLRKALTASIKKMDRLDAIPNNELSQWFTSISYQKGNKNSLELVDFKVIPIWQLFADSQLSNAILAQVLKLQEQSNNIIPDQELGTDNYVISLSNNAFTFSDSSNPATSLVKIFYVNKMPVLEICEEYVPKIRSDRRIKVFYPIYQGKTNHAQGLFPGDGEGNRPAMLSFYNGEVYVTPLDEYGSSQQLTTLYYIHGNLYDRDYGNACSIPRNTTVRDHRLQFSEWTVTYPVVKIGSGYWTRTYVTRSMSFGVRSSGRFKTYETVDGGILFANIYETNNSAFLSANSEIYGPATEEYSNKQTLWYLPLSDDRQHLTDYLGRNLKALFKGQMSGFDAAFEGYFGSYDDAGNSLGQNARRYQNEKCYIAFKDGATTSTGEALVLSPNYTWDRIVTSTTFNYYPVRLFRTAYFIHKEL